jgi:hypothetical protein
MRVPRVLLIVPMLGVGLAVPAIAAAHDDRQEYRFEGQTYERMRELAHVLDQRAQHAANQAIGSAHHGSRAERRLLADITHFARQAAAFHRRMDRYRDAPWDVPGELNHLTDDARQVDRRIRSAHVFEHTWDDWAAVVDALAQMQRSPVVERGRDRYYENRDNGRYREHDVRRY